MKVIMGPASDMLEALAHKLEISYIPLEMRVFPDGEVCPRVLQTGDYDHVYLFNQLDYRNFDPNKYILNYYLMVKTLSDIGIKRMEIIMPYLPYGRQDRSFRLGEPFSLRYILELFSKSGVSRIYTLMAHIPRLTEIIGITEGMRVVNISVVDAVVDYINSLNFDNPLIVGPDCESEKWADAISHSLGVEHVVLDKNRDINTGEVKTRGSVPNLRGRQVVIVDDIISTGRTVENAIHLINKKNPDSIHVIAIHGIFTSGAIDGLSKYNVPIITSNTIHNPFSKIPIENIITRAIKKW